SQQTTQANWVYPITGATGIDEIVRSYVKIERLADLQDDAPTASDGVSSPFGGTSHHVVFSDVLKFTTTLTASATPHLVLNASIGSLRVKDASFTGAAYRLDKHNVIVAIARDKILIDRDVRDRRGVAVNLSAPGADARASAGVPSARASARVQNARASARVVEAR